MKTVGADKPKKTAAGDVIQTESAAVQGADSHQVAKRLVDPSDDPFVCTNVGERMIRAGSEDASQQSVPADAGEKTQQAAAPVTAPGPDVGQGCIATAPMPPAPGATGLAHPSVSHALDVSETRPTIVNGRPCATEASRPILPERLDTRVADRSCSRLLWPVSASRMDDGQAENR